MTTLGRNVFNVEVRLIPSYPLGQFRYLSFLKPPLTPPSLIHTQSPGSYINVSVLTCHQTEPHCIRMYVTIQFFHYRSQDPKRQALYHIHFYSLSFQHNDYTWKAFKILPLVKESKSSLCSPLPIIIAVIKIILL